MGASIEAAARRVIALLTTDAAAGAAFCRYMHAEGVPSDAIGAQIRSVLWFTLSETRRFVSLMYPTFLAAPQALS